MFLVCTSCGEVIHLDNTLPKTDYPCPECSSIMVDGNFLELMEGSREATNSATWFTEEEYWKKVLGRGVAKERVNPQILTKLLLDEGIIVNSGEVKQIGNPPRILVDTLSIGKYTYHFCASSKGATIFKVTENEKRDD